MLPKNLHTNCINVCTAPSELCNPYSAYQKSWNLRPKIHHLKNNGKTSSLNFPRLYISNESLHLSQPYLIIYCCSFISSQLLSLTFYLSLTVQSNFKLCMGQVLPKPFFIQSQTVLNFLFSYFIQPSKQTTVFHLFFVVFI